MNRFLLLFALSLLPLGLLSGAAPYRQGIVVTRLLQTSTTAAGQPIQYLKTDTPEVTAVLVEIPPGQQTGWHQHPVPCFAYILSGTVTVELEGGEVHEYKAGQAIVEAIKLLHNGTNKGAEPVKIVMFVAGEKGTAFSVMSPTR